MASTRGLNTKQQCFVDEYLVDLNAAAAARRAGYSHKTSGWIGLQLLSKPHVAAAIAARKTARAQATGITADRVVRELAALSFYDPADIGNAEINRPADIEKLPENVRRAIVGWSWDKQGRFTLKLSPKTPSLDLLARHLGMLRERIELTGKDGDPLLPIIYMPANGRDQQT